MVVYRGEMEGKMEVVLKDFVLIIPDEDDPISAAKMAADILGLDLEAEDVEAAVAAAVAAAAEEADAAAEVEEWAATHSS